MLAQLAQIARERKLRVPEVHKTPSFGSPVLPSSSPLPLSTPVQDGDGFYNAVVNMASMGSLTQVPSTQQWGAHSLPAFNPSTSVQQPGQVLLAPRRPTSPCNFFGVYGQIGQIGATSTLGSTLSPRSIPAVVLNAAPQQQRKRKKSSSPRTPPSKGSSSLTPEEAAERKRRRASQHSNKTSPENNKGKWTTEEDTLLRSLVAQYGDVHHWTRISQLMPCRNTKQCRERWCKHLDDSLKHGGWTDEEDQIILRLREAGKGWAEISRELVGRTDNTVKIRWNSLIRSQRRQARRAAKEEQIRLKKLKAAKARLALRTRAAAKAKNGNKRSPRSRKKSVKVEAAPGKPEAMSVTLDLAPLKVLPTSTTKPQEKAASPDSVVQVRKLQESTKSPRSAKTKKEPTKRKQKVVRAPRNSPRADKPNAAPASPRRGDVSAAVENNKGKWTRAEDEKLQQMVNEVGHEWTHISLCIEGRNVKQCRERWCKHLDPSLRHGEWTEAEDATILRARRDHKGWAEIARALPGRTDNKVKIRFHSLIREQQRQKARATKGKRKSPLTRLVSPTSVVARSATP